MTSNRFLCIILAVGSTLIASLTGCSTAGFVSVEQRFGSHQGSSSAEGSDGEQDASFDTEPESGYHIVEKGDTLFSISWRYGLDMHQLAQSNGLSQPYTIYPNQKLDVRPQTVRKMPKPVAQAPKTRPTAKPSSVPPPSSTPAPPPPSRPAATSSVPVAPVTGWQWPSKGKLIGKFSTRKPVNKGIDIAGKPGDSIIATAAGTVVYAGQGLRGYGNLVIIKHNETYLSAYAHTRKILVKEKESVKAGQRIAEIGSTGTDTAKLHFEIRKHGKPMNPLKLLPKR